MSTIGLNPDGSSREVKRMDIRSGTNSPRVKRGAPHSVQKLRVVEPPLLPRTENVPGEPEICVSATRTTTPEANAAPLDCWQSRQWQLSIATGSPLQM